NVRGPFSRDGSTWRRTSRRPFPSSQLTRRSVRGKTPSRSVGIQASKRSSGSARARGGSYTRVSPALAGATYRTKRANPLTSAGCDCVRDPFLVASRRVRRVLKAILPPMWMDRCDSSPAGPHDHRGYPHTSFHGVVGAGWAAL